MSEKTVSGSWAVRGSVAEIGGERAHAKAPHFSVSLSQDPATGD